MTHLLLKYPGSQIATIKWQTYHSPFFLQKKRNDTSGHFLSRHGILREELDNVVRQTSVEQFLKRPGELSALEIPFGKRHPV